MTILSLAPDEEAYIKNVNVFADLKSRMQAMGFVDGQRIKMMRKASFSGPLQVRLGTTDILIRRCYAELIEVIKI